MSRRLVWAFAVGMLFCVAVLVISPFGDLPLTMVKAVHAGAHSCPAVAEVGPAPLLLVTRLQHSSGHTPLVGSDVLSRIAALRC